MMINPSIEQLTKGEFNRYALVIATAKCARIVTDDYVEQRERAEKMIADKKGKDSNLNIAALIDMDVRDKKAVENAVQRLYRGDFNIIFPEETGTEQLK